MKYIDSFIKSNKSRIFYYIPYNTGSLILLAIDKIDTTEENKKVAYNSSLYDDEFLIDCIGVYIGFCLNVDNRQKFEYWICNDEDNKKEGYDEFLNDRYTYMGEVTLEEWEIASSKYNL